MDNTQFEHWKIFKRLNDNEIDPSLTSLLIYYFCEFIHYKLNIYSNPSVIQPLSLTFTTIPLWQISFGLHLPRSSVNTKRTCEMTFIMTSGDNRYILLSKVYSAAIQKLTGIYTCFNCLNEYIQLYHFGLQIWRQLLSYLINAFPWIWIPNNC